MGVRGVNLLWQASFFLDHYIMCLNFMVSVRCQTRGVFTKCCCCRNINHKSPTLWSCSIVHCTGSDMFGSQTSGSRLLKWRLSHYILRLIEASVVTIIFPFKIYELLHMMVCYSAHTNLLKYHVQLLSELSLWSFLHFIPTCRPIPLHPTGGTAGCRNAGPSQPSQMTAHTKKDLTLCHNCPLTLRPAKGGKKTKQHKTPESTAPPPSRHPQPWPTPLPPLWPLPFSWPRPRA